MNEEHFWDDPKAAQNVIRQCNGMKELEAKYHQMELSLASLQETVDELNQNFDEELKELLDEGILSQDEFDAQKKTILGKWS